MIKLKKNYFTHNRYNVINLVIELYTDKEICIKKIIVVLKIQFQ